MGEWQDALLRKRVRKNEGKRAVSSFSSLGQSICSNFRDYRFSYLFIWALDLWQYLVVRRPTSGAALDVHSLYWAMTGTLCLVVAVVCVRHPRSSALGERRGLDWAAMACMMLGTVILCIPPFASEVLPSVIGVAFCALGGSFALLRWLQFYSGFPIKTAIGFLAFAYLLYFILLPVTSFIPHEFSVVFIVALPAVSTLMFRWSMSNRPNPISGTLYYTRENIQGFGKIGLGVMVYGFLLGIRKGFSLSKSDPAMDFLCMAIGVLFFLLILWWVYGMNRSLDFPRLFQVLLIFLATGATLFPLFPLSSVSALSGCFSAASSIILVLLFMALIDLAHHAAFHPFVLCGIGIGLYGVPRPLGAVVADYLRVFPSEQYLAVLTLLLAYLVIICTAFLLSSRPAGCKPLFYDLAEHKPETHDKETVDDRCQTLGEAVGLSTREIEVVKLICKGRDKAYIAETLSLSENTVRSYSKNAYRKLDVHSKRELFDMIDGLVE